MALRYNAILYSVKENRYFCALSRQTKREPELIIVLRTSVSTQILYRPAVTVPSRLYEALHGKFERFCGAKSIGNYHTLFYKKAIYKKVVLDC